MSEQCHENPQGCLKVTRHTAEVSLPVCINPFAIANPAKVKCCGDVEITPACHFCRDDFSHKCEFVVTQKIQIEIPIEFGATVKVGDTFVDCDCSPCRDHCHDHEHCHECPHED